MAKPKEIDSSRLANSSKANVNLPLAEDSADFAPYQAIRMVANMRNRFRPMASKKPRFSVRRSLMARYTNCRKSVVISRLLRRGLLGHAEGFERPRQPVGELAQVS